MAERRPRLEGKVAIVVGAGSSGPGLGNGKATSILFAREGAKLLLVDTARERAQVTLDLVEAEGGEASVFQANATVADDCRRMVEAAVERYGRVDVMACIVGISRRDTVLEVDEADWDHVMAINVKSIVLACKYTIPKMIETGGGSIITLSSIAGLRANSSTPYTASKFAVVGLTKSMAADHGRDNIRVNCIAPGLIYSPMAAARMTDELRERRRGYGVLGTEGTAWDVAWAAVYLASDESRWVTGIVLPVDAGISSITPNTDDSLTQQQYDAP